MSDLPNQNEGSLPVVLVVDDNASIRDLIGWSLQLHGFEVATAMNGQEALDWIAQAEKAQQTPSIILLDMAMPAMDGATFLKRLETMWNPARPLPAVVIITAALENQGFSSPLVKQVLVKPFHVRELLEVVRRLSDKKA